MFDAVARRYDITNTVLSLGQDRFWRRATRTALDIGPGDRVLDLAAGTAVSTEELARSGAWCVAADFSVGMLRAGNARAVPKVAADATRLPFGEGTFDAVTISFGLRNVVEPEAGLREILNFGHTFAHALESVTRYRRYQHGEAVAWGMMSAALLGHEVGVTPAEDVSRIVGLVRRIGPLPAWPQVSAASLIEAMRADKKARRGKLRFVLVPRIGKAGTYDSVELKAVQRVLHFAPRLLEAAGGLRG